MSNDPTNKASEAAAATIRFKSPSFGEVEIDNPDVEKGIGIATVIVIVGGALLAGLKLFTGGR